MTCYLIDKQNKDIGLILNMEPSDENIDNDKFARTGPFEKAVNLLVKARNSPFEYLSKNPKATNAVIKATLFILYNGYFIGCISKQVLSDKQEWEWCDGVGFLIIITGLVYLGLFYFGILKPLFGEKFNTSIATPIGKMKV